MMIDIHQVAYMIKMVFISMLTDHLLILWVISLTLMAKMSSEDTTTVITDIMNLQLLKIQLHINTEHIHKLM